MMNCDGSLRGREHRLRPLRKVLSQNRPPPVWFDFLSPEAAPVSRSTKLSVWFRNRSGHGLPEGHRITEVRRNLLRSSNPTHLLKESCSPGMVIPEPLLATRLFWLPESKKVAASVQRKSPLLHFFSPLPLVFVFVFFFAVLVFLFVCLWGIFVCLFFAA